jgi:hypothetical protein
VVEDFTGRRFCLKVFHKPDSHLAEKVGAIRQFSRLEGLQSLTEYVAIDAESAHACGHPELEFALLMPWVGVSLSELFHFVSRTAPAGLRKYLNHLALIFLRVVCGLERAGIAHSDLSPSNICLYNSTGPQDELRLIDLENLFYPSDLQFSLSGTDGYILPSEESAWTPFGDRYASAILAAEFLAAQWPDFGIAFNADGYFHGNRTCEESQSRFMQWQTALGQKYPEFGYVLQCAWYSTSRRFCPSAVNLLESLTADLKLTTTAVAGMQLPPQPISALMSPAQAKRQLLIQKYLP